MGDCEISITIAKSPQNTCLLVEVLFIALPRAYVNKLSDCEVIKTTNNSYRKLVESCGIDYQPLKILL